MEDDCEVMGRHLCVNQITPPLVAHRIPRVFGISKSCSYSNTKQAPWHFRRLARCPCAWTSISALLQCSLLWHNQWQPFSGWSDWRSSSVHHPPRLEFGQKADSHSEVRKRTRHDEINCMCIHRNVMYVCMNVCMDYVVLYCTVLYCNVMSFNVMWCDLM